MRAYVISTSTCKLDSGRTFLPPPGPQWQLELDIPGVLHSLRKDVKEPIIAAESNEFHFLYRRYQDTPFLILSGMPMGQFDGVSFFMNLEASLEKVYPEHLPMDIYGPEELDLLSSYLPDQCHAVPYESLYNPDGPVAAVWSPRNSSLAKEAAINRITAGIRDLGGVSKLIVGCTTTADKIAAPLALRYSIPLIYIAPKNAALNIYHSAATYFGGIVVESSATEQAMLQYDPAIIGVCTDEQLPEAFTGLASTTGT